MSILPDRPAPDRSHDAGALAYSLLPLADIGRSLAVRKPRRYETADGPRFRVRYRQAGVERSETFYREGDADVFADIMGNGKDGRLEEALRWLASKQDGADDTVFFRDYFDRYVDQLTGVTVRTRADYHAQKRRYLTELDHLPLTLITREHVTRIVNRLDNEGRSPKTIKNVVHMLSACFNRAVEDDHMAKNPCRRIKLPKEGVDRARIRFLTHDEYGALHDALPAEYRALANFLVGTGERWSEATAAYARHVDLTNGTVRVEQAWKRVPGVGWEIGPPKSVKSWRTINAAVGALVAVEPLLRKPADIIFNTPNGHVVRHANFYNRIWQPACVDAGLGNWVDGENKREWRGPSPHDLRHTHASWLISDGVSLEAVQDQMGHESILTTRKVYGHLLPAIGIETGRSASAGLARALGNPVQGGPLQLGSAT